MTKPFGTARTIGTTLTARSAWLVASLVIFGCGEDKAVSDSEDSKTSGPKPSSDTMKDPIDAGAGKPDAAAEVESAQLPPQGEAEIEKWLAAEHYKSWRCEEKISPPRPGGPHGHTRICWNDKLVDAADTPFPAGASLVKELYTSDEKPNGVAVNVKVKDGSGSDTWYFYERIGSGAAVADGVGVSGCAGCHSGSPNDHVFVRPR